MFKVGQKVKLKDSVEVDDYYNGLSIDEHILFEEYLPIVKIDPDNTVKLSNGWWYGIDALEAINEKFEQQESSALSFLKNG